MKAVNQVIRAKPSSRSRRSSAPQEWTAGAALTRWPKSNAGGRPHAPHRRSALGDYLDEGDPTTSVLRAAGGDSGVSSTCGAEKSAAARRGGDGRAAGNGHGRQPRPSDRRCGYGLGRDSGRERAAQPEAQPAARAARPAALGAARGRRARVGARIRRRRRARCLGFRFTPGMLFGAPLQWWSSRRPRQTPHEGLDFHLFARARRFGRAGGGGVHDPARDVRASIRPGVVAAVFADFVAAPSSCATTTSCAKTACCTPSGAASPTRSRRATSCARGR